MADSNPNTTFVLIFDILLGFGFCSLLAIAFTAALSNRIRRVFTWFHFIFSWILFSGVNFMIIRHQIGTPPGFILCLIQAAFVYATPPYCAFTAAAFVLQVFFSIVSIIEPHRSLRKSHKCALILIPLIVLLGVTTAVIMLGLKHPQNVEREPSGLYCHLSNDIIANSISSVLVIAAMLTMIIIEIFAINIVRKNRHLIGHFHDPNSNGLAEAVFRMCMFSLLAMLAFGTGVMFVVHQNFTMSPRLSITLAILPASASIIFGTQKDILSVWLFWRYTKSHNDISPNPGSNHASRARPSLWIS